MNDLLNAELVVKDTYLSDAPIEIRIRLTNVSDQDVFFLKAGTPFEGLHSDCFDVHDALNDRTVHYDGFHVKRGAPNLGSFVFVGRKSKVETTVDLGSAYDVSTPGRYTVAVRSTVSYCIGILDGALLADFRQNQGKLRTQTVSTGPYPFHVLPGLHKRMTNGEKNRNPMAQNRVRSLAAGTPTPPNITGADSTQTAQINQAHQNAYGLVVGALNNLGPLGGPASSDPTYSLWFGVYTDARFNIITAVYGQVKTNFEGPAITYFVSRPDCQSSWFGYTSYGSTTIYLCAMFWTAPPTGTDSQAGTLVHEHTHSDANTTDIAYGQNACQSLASTNPDQAVNNADSYEYYAGG